MTKKYCVVFVQKFYYDVEIEDDGTRFENELEDEALDIAKEEFRDWYDEVEVIPEED